jgi:phosphatidylethanolamine N-methyltransferase
MLNLGLLALQLLIFFYLPRHTARWFFLVYFTFWRTAYDAGLGWLLTKQSKRGWIVREVKRLGWLDEQRQPGIRNWIRDQLAGKMGKDYSFDVSCALLPHESSASTCLISFAELAIRVQYLAVVSSGCGCYLVKVRSATPVESFISELRFWLATSSHIACLHSPVSESRKVSRSLSI